MNKLWSELTPQQKKIVLYGKDDFEGVITNLQRRYSETESDFVKNEIYSKYMSKKLCPSCKGARLKKEALAVLINNKSILDITSLSVSKACDFFDNIQFNEKEKIIAKAILKEIKARLSFLNNVGLGYLNLDRES
jgi:excinuclease ABC subunit A